MRERGEMFRLHVPLVSIECVLLYLCIYIASERERQDVSVVCVLVDVSVVCVLGVAPTHARVFEHTHTITFSLH